MPARCAVWWGRESAAADNRVTALARYATHAAGLRDNATHVAPRMVERAALAALARASSANPPTASLYCIQEIKMRLPRGIGK